MRAHGTVAVFVHHLRGRRIFCRRRTHRLLRDSLPVAGVFRGAASQFIHTHSIHHAGAFTLARLPPSLRSRSLSPNFFLQSRSFLLSSLDNITHRLLHPPTQRYFFRLCWDFLYFTAPPRRLDFSISLTPPLKIHIRSDSDSIPPIRGAFFQHPGALRSSPHSSIFPPRSSSYFRPRAVLSSPHPGAADVQAPSTHPLFFLDTRRHIRARRPTHSHTLRAASLPHAGRRERSYPSSRVPGAKGREVRPQSLFPFRTRHTTDEQPRSNTDEQPKKQVLAICTSITSGRSHCTLQPAHPRPAAG